jgi:hypothetical protein
MGLTLWAYRGPLLRPAATGQANQKERRQNADSMLRHWRSPRPLLTSKCFARLRPNFPEGYNLRGLIQEIPPIQGISLGGAEAGVADYAAQFFFCGAVGYACGSHYIFF